MGSFKKLKTSDVITIPYLANKQWTFNYSASVQFTNDLYIKQYQGIKELGNFNPDIDQKYNNQYVSNVYDQINHLFYQDFPENLNTASLASSLYYESVSIQRPTSSYYYYDYNDKLIRNLPTSSQAEIRVLSISRKLFGNQINPGTFKISATPLYTIIDDKNGNIIDSLHSNIHVGNIYYSLGLIIITNPDYLYILGASVLGEWIGDADTAICEQDSTGSLIFKTINRTSTSFIMNGTTINPSGTFSIPVDGTTTFTSSFDDDSVFYSVNVIDSDPLSGYSSASDFKTQLDNITTSNPTLQVIASTYTEGIFIFSETPPPPPIYIHINNSSPSPLQTYGQTTATNITVDEGSNVSLPPGNEAIKVLTVTGTGKHLATITSDDPRVIDDFPVNPLSFIGGDLSTAPIFPWTGYEYLITISQLPADTVTVISHLPASIDTGVYNIFLFTNADGSQTQFSNDIALVQDIPATGDIILPLQAVNIYAQWEDGTGHDYDDAYIRAIKLYQNTVELTNFTIEDIGGGHVRKRWGTVFSTPPITVANGDLFEMSPG